jgi:hypothetical protein
MDAAYILRLVLPELRKKVDFIVVSLFLPPTLAA